MDQEQGKKNLICTNKKNILFSKEVEEDRVRDVLKAGNTTLGLPGC